MRLESLFNAPSSSSSRDLRSLLNPSLLAPFGRAGGIPEIPSHSEGSGGNSQGLGAERGLRFSGSASFLEISLQMHLERGIQNEAGEVIGRETVDLSVYYQKIEIKGVLEKPGEAKPVEGEGEEGEPEMPEAIRRLLEHFSPEKTAERIAQFVMRGFGRTSFGGADSPESRAGFVDFILPYIRQGVDGALQAFGELPDDVRAGAEETFRRVSERLEEFAGRSQTSSDEEAS